jgi:hypothetical protein
MSKKSRRERTPNLPPEAFNVPASSAAAKAPTVAANGAAGTVAASGISTSNRKTATAPAVVDWQGEYGEVLGDLRRTFLIFAGLVVAMIALSFVIR